MSIVVGMGRGGGGVALLGMGIWAAGGELGGGEICARVGAKTAIGRAL